MSIKPEDIADISFHSISKYKALEILKSSPKGLTEEEAQRRLEIFGPNILKEGKKTTILELFIEQFKDILVLILLGASIFSAVEGQWNESILIGVILILNAIVGVYQEWKADRAIEALKAMTAPTCTVIRDGIEKEIPSELLVPGDVYVVEAGSRIPADGRIIEAFNLKVEEGSLTGESTEVNKSSEMILPEKTALPDRINLLFMGTHVTFGRGKAVVYATGMETEMGKIAEAVQTIEEEPAPFQVKLEDFGKKLGYIILGISAIVVLAGVLIQKQPLLFMVEIGVSLAVAAIPEGLPIVITLALALGVQRMARQNAIVKKLPAVESLGSATVICTDKTGTLTMHKMTVTDILYFKDGEPVTIKNDTPLPSELPRNLKRMYEGAALCNNATIFNGEERGDPTELALLREAINKGFDPNKIEHTRLDEIPFDSERKRMSVVVEFKDGKRIAYMKGAPEVLLELCKYFDNGKEIVPLTEDLKKKLLEQVGKMADKALRVLAFSYLELEQQAYNIYEFENKMVLAGFMGMIDPPKPGVKEAIAACNTAGIRVIMVTGDHKKTAIAIAKEIGIHASEESVLTGNDLDRMTEEELTEKIKHINIFARISPLHKLDIVKALKNNDEIVAMTGDGVNDAPALKGADIGIAMGITGTDVTKETAAIVLADDNFATIVSAIKEGRTIFDNMYKFIRYMFSSNFAEVMVVFLSIMFGWPAPLVAVQILWINLITDGAPALAMSNEPPEEDIMLRPPRDPKAPLMGVEMILYILRIGTFITIGTLALYYFADFNNNYVKASTLAFASLSIMQLFNAFNVRHVKRSVLNMSVFDNRPLVIAVVSALFLQMLVIQGDNWLSFLSRKDVGTPIGTLFHTTPLTTAEWLLVFGIGFSTILIEEVFKIINKRFFKES